MIPNVLSIAGSDPSGGAGIQADLKTFSALRCYGMAAMTALTAQNTRGVSAIHAVPAEFVTAQIDAVFSDIDVAAVKIGMLGSQANVEAVAGCMREHAPAFVVLDPVLVATSGDALGGDEVATAIMSSLLRQVHLVTPNIPEAMRLTGLPQPGNVDDMRALAEALHARGARAVLVKGGHLEGEEAVDVFFDGSAHRSFSAPRVDTRNSHGTGCTLSSAIAAGMAHGLPLLEAIEIAKDFLTGALIHSSGLNVGRGHGPTHHFWRFWQS